METTELRNAGLQRLKSGEFPESIARDLKKQGLAYSEIQALFREAAARKRRSGFIRIALGIVITLATVLLVMGAAEAGIKCYGTWIGSWSLCDRQRHPPIKKRSGDNPSGRGTRTINR